MVLPASGRDLDIGSRSFKDRTGHAQALCATADRSLPLACPLEQQNAEPPHSRLSELTSWTRYSQRPHHPERSRPSSSLSCSILGSNSACNRRRNAGSIGALGFVVRTDFTSILLTRGRSRGGTTSRPTSRSATGGNTRNLCRRLLRTCSF